MLSLCSRALSSSSSNQDDVSYLTAVEHVNEIHPENCDGIMKILEDLLISSSSRLQGLYILELALRNNCEIYDRANWFDIIMAFFKDPCATEIKAKLCHILSLIIKRWTKEPIINPEKIHNLQSNLYPLLLEAADSDIEWRLDAFKCLISILKCIPLTLMNYKESILMIILKETNTVSSKRFEIFADCFSYLPTIQKTAAPESYKDSWSFHYNKTLNSMKSTLDFLLAFVPNDKMFKVQNEELFGEIEFEGQDEFGSRMIAVRRFINFSRCLTKLLSNKTKHPVQVPLKPTFDCIAKLVLVEDIVKINPVSLDNQVFLSCLGQLQIAALGVLEPILTNFGSHVAVHTGFICDFLQSVLLLSKCPNVAKEPISQVRHVVWKLIQVWLGSQGAKGAAYRIIEKEIIIKELLTDIRIQEMPPKVVVAQSQGKAKKGVTLNADTINNIYANENWFPVCKQALKALKRLLYGGGPFLGKNIFQEILTKIFGIASAIHPSEGFPFPYTNEDCRKNVYDVLLAVAIVSKSPQVDTLQHAIAIFESARQDSSNKVTSICCKASATCRFALHPKKPPPLIIDFEETHNLPSTSTALERYPAFSSEDNYIENLPPPKEEVPEDMPCHITESYHNPNDSAMPSNDYESIDSHFSKQTLERQCNGDEILEIQNSSQSQEDEESEEEGDADEYEDEERSFDEEMNEEIDLQPDHVYIPSTGELQVMTPAHVSEIVQNVVPDYDELRPSGSKVPANALSSSSKNVHVNGVRNSVPDEETPMMAAGSMANENGIFISDEEEVEEEEGDEDEEADEEDEVPHHPAEKRVPDSIDAPAAKKLKIAVCSKEVKQDQNQDGGLDPRSSSPTVEEMKRDFVFSDGEEIDEESVTETVKS